MSNPYSCHARMSPGMHTLGGHSSPMCRQYERLEIEIGVGVSYICLLTNGRAGTVHGCTTMVTHQSFRYHPAVSPRAWILSTSPFMSGNTTSSTTGEMVWPSELRRWYMPTVPLGRGNPGGFTSCRFIAARGSTRGSRPCGFGPGMGGQAAQPFHHV